MRFPLALTMTALLFAEPVPAAQAAQPAVLLAPAIAEAEPASTARGVFFTAETQAVIAGGSVLLAGSSDGAAVLCTDDEAQIVFRAADGAEQVWKHRFASDDRQTIECLPPQALALSAGPGAYNVTVRLIDRQPPRLSSQAYYLVPVAAVAPVAVPAPAVPAPAASAPAVPAPAAPAQPRASTPIPTAQASAAPAAIAQRLDGEAPPGPPLTPAGSTAGMPAAPPSRPVTQGVALPEIQPALAILLGLLAAGLLAAGLAALRVGKGRPRPATTLAGIVDLADRESGEAHTLLLHRYPDGVDISRGPLSITPWAAGVRPPNSIAAILPTPGGPELHLADRAEPVPLRDGERLLLERVIELRYRRA